MTEYGLSVFLFWSSYLRTPLNQTKMHHWSHFLKWIKWFHHKLIETPLVWSTIKNSKSKALLFGCCRLLSELVGLAGAPGWTCAAPRSDSAALLEACSRWWARLPSRVVPEQTPHTTSVLKRPWRSHADTKGPPRRPIPRPGPDGGPAAAPSSPCPGQIRRWNGPQAPPQAGLCHSPLTTLWWLPMFFPVKPQIVHQTALLWIQPAIAVSKEVKENPWPDLLNFEAQAFWEKLHSGPGAKKAALTASPQWQTVNQLTPAAYFGPPRLTSELYAPMPPQTGTERRTREEPILWSFWRHFTKRREANEWKHYKGFVFISWKVFICCQVPEVKASYLKEEKHKRVRLTARPDSEKLLWSHCALLDLSLRALSCFAVQSSFYRWPGYKRHHRSEI